MEENIQREVLQKMTCMYQKTPKKVYTVHSYIGPKLYNMIPKNIKEASTTKGLENPTQKMYSEEHPLRRCLIIITTFDKIYIFILLIESFN